MTLQSSSEAYDMTTAPTSKRRSLTPEAFEAMQDHVRYELIDGELRKRHLSTYSDAVGNKIARALGRVTDEKRLGEIGGTSGGLQIFPDRPRKVVFPDVYFISRERLGGPLPETGWLKVAPEFVVEVISPGDNANDVDEKVEEYLQAGVEIVWVVYPKTRSVMVHHPDGAVIRISKHATITGEHVLPDFSATVGSFFPD
jgi:Uma2 family endonuclease